jgi:hypothetical protein
MPQIKIDNILGGQAPTTHFGTASQFRASLGIDPAQPLDDADTVYSTIGSGLLRPAASEKFSGSTIAAAPLWIKTNPKDSLIYVLDARGSAYTIDATITTVTALNDAGELSSGLGNGSEYYDNYMYWAKNTDIARYGPLNGAPTFNGTYLTGTRATTAMVNTAYPTTFKNNIQLPNHVMHRHSDGVLYFADVVDNQGYVRTIVTSKTTVEGDTVKTADSLLFGYGLWPTSIESYGADLSVSLIEVSSTGLLQTRAKMAFWDTSSTRFNKITWVEFPDSLITAQKNVNGVLYVVSGNFHTKGFRVVKFIGGYSFQEVYYSETGEPCLQGGIDALLNRVVFGNHTTVPESDGCLYGLGLEKGSLSSGSFNLMRATGGDSSTSVTAVCFADATQMGFAVPIIGWTKAGEGSTGATHGLDKQGTAYNNAPSVFWGPMIRVGQRFKVTKVTIPLAQAMAANMIITPKLYFDDGTASHDFNGVVINNTAYPGKKDIVLRPTGATGGHNFWLELRWTGSALCVVNLPIIIDFDLIKSNVT